MKKLLLFVFLFMLSYSGLYAYSSVGGTIDYNAYWSGTVYVYDDVIVKDGAVVTIAEGTVVKVADDKGIYVNYGAQINIDWDNVDQVIFTSKHDDEHGEIIAYSNGTPVAGDWLGLSFYNKNGEINLARCDILYSGGDGIYDAAVNVIAKDIKLHYVHVDKTEKDGFKVKGKNVTMDHCQAFGCGMRGIRVDKYAYESIKIDNCEVDTCGSSGVSINADEGHVIITNNIFYKNAFYGIEIYGDDDENITTLTLGHNDMHQNGEASVFLRKVSFFNAFYENDMTGNGINGYYIDWIGDNDTLNLYNLDNVPYVLGEYCSLEKLMNIYEGTIIKIDDSGYSEGLGVGADATLNVMGTEEHPVIFTHLADDNWGGDTESNGSATQPTTCTIIVSAGHTRVDHAKFFYGNVRFTEDGEVKHSLFENTGTQTALWGRVVADSCEFNNNYIAVSAYYDTSFINHCVFENNTIGILNNENIVVRNSTFSSNEYGAKFTYAEYSDFGKNTTDSIGNNIFTNNNWDMYNQTNKVIYAYMNDWDGETADEIDAKLYDDDENPEKGPVLFEPWLGQCLVGVLPMPQGPQSFCQNVDSTAYTVENNDPNVFVTWVLMPDTAGVIYSAGNLASILWSDNFTGTAYLWVYGSDGTCDGENSDTLVITRYAAPETLPLPEGDTIVCESVLTSVYSVTNNNDDVTVNWQIAPASAGTLYPSGNLVSVDWNPVYEGDVQLWAYGSNPNCSGENSDTLTIHRVAEPEELDMPVGDVEICHGTAFTHYSVTDPGDGVSVNWELMPVNAGAITVMGNEADVYWNPDFAGTAYVWVYATNDNCVGPNSDSLIITLYPEAVQLPMPEGDVNVCQSVTSSVYTVVNEDDDMTINWEISPSTAGMLNPAGNQLEIVWSPDFVGDVMLWASGSYGSCEGVNSDTLLIHRFQEPLKPEMPQGDQVVCQNVEISHYVVNNPEENVILIWELVPAEAGALTINDNESDVVWNPDYTGIAYLWVYGSNENCVGPNSDSLEIHRIALPEQLNAPTGPEYVCENVLLTQYSVVNINENAYVQFDISPAEAGTLEINDNEVSVNWASGFLGDAYLWAYGVSEEGGCEGPVSDSLLIHRIAKPETPVITQQGDTLFSTEALAYQWYKRVGEGEDSYLEPIAGATEQYYVPETTGIYVVEVFNMAEACSSFSDDFVFEFTGVNVNSLTEVRIYPNPVSGTLHLNFGKLSSGEIHYSIVDLVGKNLVEGTVSGQREMVIDVSNFDKGIYLLHLVRDQSVITHKIIKE